MRTAHLILTYTDPKQTERMIRKMYHPDFDFYIHLDQKVDIKSHLYLSNLKNVYFIQNRIDVRWAGYNTVKAVFNSIREICDTGKKYNFINLLSGQDYPLKSANHLSDFFKKNKGKEFIAYRDIINDWKSAQNRYKKFHLTNFRFKGRVLYGQYRLEKAINFFSRGRKIPYKFHPYGKSMFWMLSPEAALYVVNKVQGDKKLEKFFSYTWASDEFLFQTIIMNSEYRDRVVNNNYRYIDWSEKKPNPKVLNGSDFEKLKLTTMLFGRKFDVSKDSRIMDMLDTIL
jgi:hypothetical protein